jgi:hypothetical protein
MPVLQGGNILGGTSNLQLAEATYSFAVSGGAVGDIVLPQSDTIPLGAIILGGLVEVTTVPTSGGAATVAVKVEGAGDIVAAAAISGAPWSTTGRKSVIPVFTGATTIKTTVTRSVTIAVATAALTAGKFRVVLVYL